MKHAFAAAVLLAASALAPEAAADQTPRRSEPLWIAGITGISTGLSVAAVSGIIAATQECVTFPGLTSGCRPEFENTYALPLILAGGVLTVVSLPLFSIGFERDKGPLEVSSIEVRTTSLRVTF